MALIELTIDQRVAWLTLNNPQTHNALSLPLLEELESILDKLSTERSLCCLVIHGAGKSFCAGGDLAGFKADLERESSAFINRLEYAQVVLNKVETFPAPTIAAVHGYAIAGGLELILCCDLVIAARSARIGDGHAKYGIIPAAGSSARLHRKLPPNRANYLLYSAAVVEAERLESWGLINEVVSEDTLFSVTREHANAMAQHSPLGLRTIKQLLTRNEQRPPLRALENEIRTFEQYKHSHDFREGLQAFEDKRPPVFLGH
jgi:enoyl-CoA hydratase/carnithine racemase